MLDVVEAVGGKVIGQVLEGQSRFFLQVRFAPDNRDDLAKIGDLKVADPRGRLIPLSQLADIRIESGPAQISSKPRASKAVV